MQFKDWKVLPMNNTKNITNKNEKPIKPRKECDGKSKTMHF